MDRRNGTLDGRCTVVLNHFQPEQVVIGYTVPIVTTETTTAEKVHTNPTTRVVCEGYRHISVICNGLQIVSSMIQGGSALIYYS